MSGARTRLGRKGREGDQLEGREPAFEMLVLVRFSNPRVGAQAVTRADL